MSLTIKYFKVTDTSTGHIQPTGNKEYLWNNANASILNNLSNHRLVTGTPSSITQDILKDIAHMGVTYIKIINDFQLNLAYDGIFIVDKIRIAYIGGSCAYKNSIIYGFAANNTTASEDINWNVLFANSNAQTTGDYFDIELPDRTLYPNLFLALAIIPNGWTNRNIIDISNKIYSLSGSTTYFNINKTYSSIDTTSSHTINIQGYDQVNGILSRVVLAFEDRQMSSTDKDYFDVIVSVSCAYFDEININDTIIF